MSYSYEEYRKTVFTPEGQVQFLKIRDNVKRLLKDAGAFTTEKAIENCTGGIWEMLACVDRLVELGEIRCVLEEGWRQFWVYTWGGFRAG